MKKLLATFFATALLSISLTTISHAQQANKDVGIGFMVGEPTGLSLKSWTGGNNAFDLGLAWSLSNDNIQINADYLWHNYDVFDNVNSGSLPLYYGIGGRVIFDDNDAVVGARVPVGINYLFDDSPIGLFLEIAPVFNVAPDTDFDVEGGVGVRFYL